MSEVGIYFGRHSLKAKENTQVCCLLGFNDFHAWKVDSRGNPASRAGFYLGRAIGTDLNSFSAELREILFTPPREHRWRSLAIRVTREGIEPFWEGMRLGMIQWGELKKQESLPWLEQPAEITPTDIPRGGLGLFVRGGAAAFRRVHVQPLK